MTPQISAKVLDCRTGLAVTVAVTETAGVGAGLVVGRAVMLGAADPHVGEVLVTAAEHEMSTTAANTVARRTTGTLVVAGARPVR
jgi:hypothetical protein